MARVWKKNPGKRKEPKNPDARVWLRFMNGREYKEKVRAGDWNWKHRDFDFDIKEATQDDPE